MAKIRVVSIGETEVYYLYNCPGCGYEHAFSPNVHQFSGDLNNPTVSPSLLHSNPQHYHTCHSYIRDGMIQFLGDCWHELKGKTVPLPDYTDPIEGE